MRRVSESQGQCKAAGCARQVSISGHCARHYQQVRKYGRLTPELEYSLGTDLVCGVQGCEAPRIAKGYCTRHYQQVRRRGRLIQPK